MLSAETLLLYGALLTAVSGVPGLLLDRRSSLGQYVSLLLVLAGAGLVSRAAWLHLTGAPSAEWRFPSSVPGADFAVALDPISVFFLLPIVLISTLGTIYGLQYWRQADHPENGRKVRLFYGLVAASMEILVTARTSVTFLFAWEIMAVVNFFLVATEDENEEVRRTGWLYLAASHSATLLLFLMFGLLYSASGTYDLVPVGAMSPAVSTAIFVTALVGFGVKAGIWPGHFWLPSAHAMAPSHMSALMSGVVIKMGIYGIVRTLSLIPAVPGWWGGVLLALGVVSGILGVVFAIGQHDLKRLLAYHSIENIGIIVMGIGLAALGRAYGRPDWIVLGLAGGLLHVWNHGLFKSLLFFGAGSVIHATHTREIDELGGLARRMPWTSTGFLVGAIAICGLPPLNGFVSELLIYLGIFRTAGVGAGPACNGAAFVAPALAMVGALAVACFVKVYGAVFLGAERSDHARHAHECGASMKLPLVVLAGLCLTVGVWPAPIAPLLDRCATAWVPAAPAVVPAVPVAALPHLADLVPFEWVTIAAFLLIALVAVAALALRARVHAAPVSAAGTWDCGYAAPSARMQYTSSSFAQMLVGLFAWALRPKVRLHPPAGSFPEPASFHSDVPDLVLHRAVYPGTRAIANVFTWVRVLQQGKIQVYFLYVFLALLAFLVWSH